jgi:hypothetical protein
MNAEEKEKKPLSEKAAAAKRKKQRESRLLAKKPYIEFITAILSIPVLITVIILNFSNLQHLGKSQISPTPSEKSDVTAPDGTAPTTKDCKKVVGPITINSPQEGDSLDDNPVAVTLSHDDDTYCPIVWSYRINGGSWSAYDDNPIALYNLKQGDVTLDLRVKSLSSSDSETITRNFTYEGNQKKVPTPDQSDKQASISGR